MAYIHVRTDEKLKKRVQGILKRIGVDLSTAINSYLIRIDLTESIPFEMSAKAMADRKNDDFLFPDRTYRWGYPLPEELPKRKRAIRPLGIARGQVDVEGFMKPLPKDVLDAFNDPNIEP